MIVRNLRTVSLMALAVLLAVPADASSRQGRCEPVVEQEVSRLQVDPGRVGAISIQVRRHENRQGNSRIQGVLGWVELTDCAGRLVVDMARNCRVKQVYTRGECTVPGVAAF